MSWEEEAERRANLLRWGKQANLSEILGFQKIGEAARVLELAGVTTNHIIFGDGSPAYWVDPSDLEHAAIPQDIKERMAYFFRQMQDKGE